MRCNRFRGVLAIAVVIMLALVTGLSGTGAQGAVVTWTADVFDADADISTAGTLVEAYNLGWGAGVTTNGVSFAPDPGSAAFMASSGSDFNHGTLYGGGAIGSMSFTDTHLLLDTVEFGPGAGNSLARVDGLTVGKDYTVQVLIVDDRTGSAAVTVDFGYATPSGSATEVYPLTGLDHTSSSPQVITGTFTADETVQDLHIQYSDAQNGLAQAYQLRVAADEPPPPVSNVALGKEYAYMSHLPGETSGTGPHYLDVGHAGTNAVGVFDAGQLTDDAVGTGTESTTTGQYVAFLGSAGGDLPAAEIVMDLGDSYSIEDIVLGTVSRDCCGMGAPDDVDISFSITSATSGFGPATDYTLWNTASLPLALGHHELTLPATSSMARWVKFSFDGGILGPGFNKYMLDEIVVHGAPITAVVPEPSTFITWSLGLLGLGWYARRRRTK